MTRRVLLSLLTLGLVAGGPISAALSPGPGEVPADDSAGALSRLDLARLSKLQLESNESPLARRCDTYDEVLRDMLRDTKTGHLDKMDLFSKVASSLADRKPATDNEKSLLSSLQNCISELPKPSAAASAAAAASSGPAISTASAAASSQTGPKPVDAKDIGQDIQAQLANQSLSPIQVSSQDLPHHHHLHDLHHLEPRLPDTHPLAEELHHVRPEHDKHVRLLDPDEERHAMLHDFIKDEIFDERFEVEMSPIRQLEVLLENERKLAEELDEMIIQAPRETQGIRNRLEDLRLHLNNAHSQPHIHSGEILGSHLSGPGERLALAENFIRNEILSSRVRNEPILARRLELLLENQRRLPGWLERVRRQAPQETELIRRRLEELRISLNQAVASTSLRHDSHHDYGHGSLNHHHNHHNHHNHYNAYRDYHNRNGLSSAERKAMIDEFIRDEIFDERVERERDPLRKLEMLLENERKLTGWLRELLDDGQYETEGLRQRIMELEVSLRDAHLLGGQVQNGHGTAGQHLEMERLYEESARRERHSQERLAEALRRVAELERQLGGHGLDGKLRKSEKKRLEGHEWNEHEVISEPTEMARKLHAKLRPDEDLNTRCTKYFVLFNYPSKVTRKVLKTVAKMDLPPHVVERHRLDPHYLESLQKYAGLLGSSADHKARGAAQDLAYCLNHHHHSTQQVPIHFHHDLDSLEVHHRQSNRHGHHHHWPSAHHQHQQVLSKGPNQVWSYSQSRAGAGSAGAYAMPPMPPMPGII